MSKLKYSGIFPAFYACYDKDGKVCPETIKKFTKYLLDKGVNGLYVCGSSGECIYQSVEERKLVLESVMEVARGKTVIIAHVAATNTKESKELAAHADSLGVDAISAIPPIYYRVPDSAIREYWNEISLSAPNSDFIAYNIPQLSGVSISPECLKEMAKNPKVVGIKNTSLSILDIIAFKEAGDREMVVFNGPDEQLAYGLLAGACGGIGGTYGACPELYMAIYKAIKKGEVDRAIKLQRIALKLIEKLTTLKGGMYAVIKEIIKIRTGLDLGGVREPLVNVFPCDMEKIKECASFIDDIEKEL